MEGFEFTAKGSLLVYVYSYFCLINCTRFRLPILIVSQFRSYTPRVTLRNLAVEKLRRYLLQAHFRSLVCKTNFVKPPILVAAWSKAWICGRLLVGIVGSNPIGGMDAVFCECCLLSGRGLCVGQVTRPRQSYRLWCVECNCEASKMRPWPTVAVEPW